MLIVGYEVNSPMTFRYRKFTRFGNPFRPGFPLYLLSKDVNSIPDALKGNWGSSKIMQYGKICYSCGSVKLFASSLKRLSFTIFL